VLLHALTAAIRVGRFAPVQTMSIVEGRIEFDGQTVYSYATEAKATGKGEMHAVVEALNAAKDESNRFLTLEIEKAKASVAAKAEGKEGKEMDTTGERKRPPKRKREKLTKKEKKALKAKNAEAAPAKETAARSKKKQKGKE
jgi:hypothetical protein